MTSIVHGVYGRKKIREGSQIYYFFIYYDKNNYNFRFDCWNNLKYYNYKNLVLLAEMLYTLQIYFTS